MDFQMKKFRIQIEVLVSFVGCICWGPCCMSKIGNLGVSLGEISKIFRMSIHCLHYEALLSGYKSGSSSNPFSPAVIWGGLRSSSDFYYHFRLQLEARWWIWSFEKQLNWDLYQFWLFTLWIIHHKPLKILYLAKPFDQHNIHHK